MGIFTIMIMMAMIGVINMSRENAMGLAGHMQGHIHEVGDKQQQREQTGQRAGVQCTISSRSHGAVMSVQIEPNVPTRQRLEYSKQFRNMVSDNTPD